MCFGRWHNVFEEVKGRFYILLMYVIRRSINLQLPKYKLGGDARLCPGEFIKIMSLLVNYE